VGVVDAVGGSRFAQHPCAQMRLAAQVWTDQFDGDDTVDENVPRAINDTHPAFADTRLEAVATGDDLAQGGIVRPLT